MWGVVGLFVCECDGAGVRGGALCVRAHTHTHTWNMSLFPWNSYLGMLDSIMCSRRDTNHLGVIKRRYTLTLPYNTQYNTLQIYTPHYTTHPVEYIECSSSTTTCASTQLRWGKVPSFSQRQGSSPFIGDLSFPRSFLAPSMNLLLLSIHWYHEGIAERWLRELSETTAASRWTTQTTRPVCIDLHKHSCEYVS